MSHEALRKVLTVYETGAGLGGIWMLVAGYVQFHGPLGYRLLFGALLVGYCLLLAAAGILLGRHQPLGLHLPVYAQACQIPQVVTHAITFVVFTPASLTLALASHGEVTFALNIAADVRLQVGHQPDSASIGINLLALLVLAVLTRRLARPAPATSGSGVAA